MGEVWGQMTRFSEGYVLQLMNVIVPLGILVVGWLIAMVARVLVHRLLRRTELDDKLARLTLGEAGASKIKPEKWISKGVYYLLMLFVLVAFFQFIGLTLVTEPLNQLLVQLFAFLPLLVSAGLLLLLAWIVARLSSTLAERVLSAAKLEERLGETPEDRDPNRLSISESVGKAVYWLVFLVFLPAVLGALGLDGLMAPVREMVGKAMGFVPNLLAGGLILLVGWFGARITQRIVVNLLTASNLDQTGKKAGLDAVLGERSFSSLVGWVLYYAIFILAIIAALDALQFEVISRPASAMLGRILDAIPSVFTAGLVLIVAYMVGRLVQEMVVSLLTKIGFNALLERMGISTGEDAEERNPAVWAGHLTMVVILLFAAIEAADLLGFVGLQALLIDFTRFAGQVGMGLIIFILGLYLGNLVGDMISRKELAQSKLVASGARAVVIVLTSAMALRQMGIANDIINMAFGLFLGGIAAAVALAFGLGCRDLASDAVKGWLTALGKKEEGDPDQ